MSIEKPLDIVAKEIKAALDQADKAQTRADDLKLTAGRMLLDAKERIKKEGGKWLDYLAQHKLDKRRSQEVMKIAKGETTPEQMRDKNASRQEQYRKESALRNALSTSNQSRLATASVKMEGKQVEEIRTVTSETALYDWDKDIRTQRLKADLLQANKKINGLVDEIDELREPAKLCRQIKSYLQGESPQDWKGLVKMSGGKDW